MRPARWSPRWSSSTTPTSRAGQRPSLLATEASQIPPPTSLGEDFENFLRSVNDDEQA